MQALVRYKKKEVPKEIRGLFEPGAVCFEYISQFVDPDELDPEILEKIKGAVCEKVFRIMITGTFGDLRGARELLEKLEIEDIFIPEADVFILNVALMRVSENALLHLGFSKPLGMTNYDLKKAREILKDVGYSEKELASDEIVKKIVNWRHVLMELKRRKIKMIGGAQNLLEACKEE